MPGACRRDWHRDVAPLSRCGVPQSQFDPGSKFWAQPPKAKQLSCQTDQIFVSPASIIVAGYFQRHCDLKQRNIFGVQRWPLFGGAVSDHGVVHLLCCEPELVARVRFTETPEMILSR